MLSSLKDNLSPKLILVRKELFLTMFFKSHKKRSFFDLLTPDLSVSDKFLFKGPSKEQ